MDLRTLSFLKRNKRLETLVQIKNKQYLLQSLFEQSCVSKGARLPWLSSTHLKVGQEKYACLGRSNIFHVSFSLYQHSGSILTRKLQTVYVEITCKGPRKYLSSETGVQIEMNLKLCWFCDHCACSEFTWSALFFFLYVLINVRFPQYKYF